jgi:LacI family transcriptional regulator
MKIPRVALLIETSNAYARGLLEGVAQHLHEQGMWSVVLPERGRGDPVPGWLRGWNGDGIIVRAESRGVARAVAASRLPAVDLSAAGLLPGAPWVHSDVRAEAQAGFAHLWDRGYRRLGFCGVTEYQWAEWQRDRFVGLAREVGCECSDFVRPLRSANAAGWTAGQRALAHWLRRLRKPVGIFACFDVLGQQVLDACRTAGIRVPDDVAVVGVDNDPLRCGLSDPPLSSVVPDTRRVGYVAARILRQMMSGARVPPEPHLVAPLGVVARRSSDALAIEDPDVSAAVRYIREHACEPMNVKQVMDNVPISRRALESRFRKLLGRSPHDEILRCRIERAKQLLSETELPVKAVADRVGVGNSEYLSVLFRRLEGCTPIDFRRKHRRV